MIGVQAEGCAAAVESMDVHHPVEIEQASTIADGIAVKRPGNLTLPLLERWLDGIVTVDDEAIVGAMVRLAERTKLVTEGAGAVGVAALDRRRRAGPERRHRRGALGRQRRPALLAAAINRHEITESRRVRITPASPTAPAASPICSRRSPSPAPTSSRSPTSVTSPTSTSRRPRSTSPSRPAAPITPPSSGRRSPLPATRWGRASGRNRRGGAGSEVLPGSHRGWLVESPARAETAVHAAHREQRPPRRGCEHAIPRPDDGPPDASREPGQPSQPPQVLRPAPWRPTTLRVHAGPGIEAISGPVACAQPTRNVSANPSSSAISIVAIARNSVITASSVVAMVLGDDRQDRPQPLGAPRDHLDPFAAVVDLAIDNAAAPPRSRSAAP